MYLMNQVILKSPKLHVPQNTRTLIPLSSPLFSQFSSLRTLLIDQDLIDKFNLTILKQLRKLVIFGLEIPPPSTWSSILTALTQLEVFSTTDLLPFHILDKLTNLRKLTVALDNPELQEVQEEEHQCLAPLTKLKTLIVQYCPPTLTMDDFRAKAAPNPIPFHAISNSRTLFNTQISTQGTHVPDDHSKLRFEANSMDKHHSGTGRHFWDHLVKDI